MGLEELVGLDDEVAEVLALALRVVDLVALVQIPSLEKVHDWEDLAVVGHEGLSDGVTAGDEFLQDLEGGGDHLDIARVERD